MKLCGTFYNKWLDSRPNEELFRYLTIDFIANQRNMGDIDLAILFHLTDPECYIHLMQNVAKV